MTHNNWKSVSSIDEFKSITDPKFHSWGSNGSSTDPANLVIRCSRCTEYVPMTDIRVGRRFTVELPLCTDCLTNLNHA